MINPVNQVTSRVFYSAISQGHLYVFHRPVLSQLRERGYKVTAVANFSAGFRLEEADEVLDLQFGRNPLSLQNLSALRKMIGLMRKNAFKIVHCHTPVASALTRIAALFSRRPRPIVIYTAHGFHFYPKAPLANWLLWFSMEWLLARITDVIVVINSWDERAAKRLLRAKRVCKIPGMGVDLERFTPSCDELRRAAREFLWLEDSELVILYVAEMIPRKNHAFIIRCLPEILSVFPETVVLFAGDGPLGDFHRRECERLGISENVRFLGFRSDVEILCHAADISISASRHEGLPIGLAEAMAGGLPIVASEDRGHRELVVHGENGFLFAQNDDSAFIGRVLELCADPGLRKRLGARGRDLVAQFSVTASLQALAHVYDAAEAVARSRGLDVPGG